MTRVTTLRQVESLVSEAAERLGKIDVAARRNYVSALLLLKRCSDVFDESRSRVHARELARTGDAAEAAEAAADPDEYTDVIFVPPESSWPRLLGVTNMVGPALNGALQGLEKYNPDLANVLSHIDFNRDTGGARLRDAMLTDLIRLFNDVSLRNADLEFPELIGDAYERLLAMFAGSAGAKSGDMYTPSPIVRLMVQLAEPAPDQTLYDPCAGSGGMLIESRRYVADHHPGKSLHLALAGQELAPLQWVSARLNLLFHGIRDADVKLGDTLSDPQHVDGGGLRRFDRILSNPEFSKGYDAKAVEAKGYGRFTYGTGVKDGDLMFVQHMVASLAGGGLAVTVMPHGVLFRSGREEVIRRGLLADDVIEAIVGLGEGLFSGTGIPACLVLLRAPGGKPAERRGRILIVNADREYRPGRARNHLGEEHIEKISAVCREWREVAGFSRIVTVGDVLADDANLNIRRWVDNSPPAEPQDVSAHLYGGVPVPEVDALRPAFAAFGLDAGDFFVPLDEGYVDVPADGPAGTAARIEELAAGAAAELSDRCGAWWNECGSALLEVRDLGAVTVKRHLVTSFGGALASQRVMDEFTLTGLAAQWWIDHLEEVQALAAGGPRRVVESWAAAVRAKFQARSGRGGRGPAASSREAREQPLAIALIPGPLEKARVAEAAFAELDAQVKALSEEEETATPAAERRRLTKARTAARKLRDQAERELPARFADAVGGVTDKDAEEIVLAVLGADLVSRFDARVADALRLLVARYRSIVDKYEVSLEELEQDRWQAAERLTGFLTKLDYPRRVKRRMPEKPAL
ncbi:class I SAM-dependent DNA methyltransferase [Spirillospora sp. NPDC046719]